MVDFRNRPTTMRPVTMRPVAMRPVTMQSLALFRRLLRLRGWRNVQVTPAHLWTWAAAGQDVAGVVVGAVGWIEGSTAVDESNQFVFEGP